MLGGKQSEMSDWVLSDWQSKALPQAFEFLRAFFPHTIISSKIVENKPDTGGSHL
jgi:hypothetical protein